MCNFCDTPPQRRSHGKATIPKQEGQSNYKKWPMPKDQMTKQAPIVKRYRRDGVSGYRRWRGRCLGSVLKRSGAWLQYALVRLSTLWHALVRLSTLRYGPGKESDRITSDLLRNEELSEPKNKPFEGQKGRQDGDVGPLFPWGLSFSSNWNHGRATQENIRTKEMVALLKQSAANKSPAHLCSI